MTPLKYNIQLHPQLIHPLEAEVLQQSNNEVTMLGYPVYINVNCVLLCGCMLGWCELPCIKIKVKPDAVQCKRTTMKLALSIAGTTKKTQGLLGLTAMHGASLLILVLVDTSAVAILSGCGLYHKTCSVCTCDLYH